MSDTPTQSPESAAALAGPAEFALGSKTFVLAPATAEDLDAARAACRRMVRAEMADPVEVLNARAARMHEKAAAKKGPPLMPDVLRALADSAMASASGDGGEGKAEPTPDQILAKSQSVEGIRWWVAYRLRKVDQAVTDEWVARHVTEENAATIARRMHDEVDRLGKS